MESLDGVYISCESKPMKYFGCGELNLYCKKIIHFRKIYRLVQLNDLLTMIFLSTTIKFIYSWFVQTKLLLLPPSQNIRRVIFMLVLCAQLWPIIYTKLYGLRMYQWYCWIRLAKFFHSIYYYTNLLYIL